MELSVEKISGGYKQDKVPSPDYPSEIETVGSNVNLLENKAITQTINGVTFIVNKDGSIMANGTSTSQINLYLGDAFSLEAGTYLLTDGQEQNDSSTTYFTYIDPVDCSTAGNKIFTIDNATKIIGRIVIRSGQTLNNVIFKPKLEKGTVATPYSPYGMGSVEIDVVNKNFFDKNKALQGYELNETTGQISTNSLFFTSDYIRVNPNGQYFLSGKQDGTSNCFYDKNKKYLTKVTLTNGLLTVPDNSDICYLRINARLTSIDTTMIEKGTERTDYVEGQSQTVIMPIQQEMLIGDYVADVEHHEWGKLIFDENSDIECVHADGTFQFRFLKYIEGTDATTKVICNMAKYWNTGAWGENGCFVSWNGYFFILCKENEFGFNANMTTDEAITHFKTKLANSKLIVYYKLATPINLELTEEQKAIRKQKLYTYKNITNISLSDELASIDVTYKKDLETMFNNIIKPIPSSTSDTAET